MKVLSLVVVALGFWLNLASADAEPVYMTGPKSLNEQEIVPDEYYWSLLTIQTAVLDNMGEMVLDNYKVCPELKAISSAFKLKSREVMAFGKELLIEGQSETALEALLKDSLSRCYSDIEGGGVELFELQNLVYACYQLMTEGVIIVEHCQGSKK